PRVYAVAPGAVRLLDSLGAWARVAALRAGAYTRMEVWEGSAAQALAFDAAEMAVPELGFIVEDAALRASLWPAVAGAATVLAGTAVTGYAREDGITRLALADGSTLEAGLVIAAEGADSPLREWAGIDAGGWDYPQRALVSHVETQRPRADTAYQRFLPLGPLALLPLPDGRSSIVWSTRSNEAEELLGLDDAAFAQRLEEALDRRLGGIGACSPRRSFPLRLLHASAYVADGLALVGDSAHVVHPLAGQGLNLGLGDVAALAEVVAEARGKCQPLASLRVLQRYERRRRAANIEALALTDGLHRLFGMRGGQIESLRELGLSMFGRAGPLKHALARRAMGL
ncbi:MAG TPA: FAD-dependent monooxygenase, partial [Verrucomicrobiae bacterium]|nr:FAD-dependent monooxygenase [Verrucomicrobiae bacterium]